MIPIDVLLVEDAAGDAVLAIQLLSEFPSPVKVHIARGGLQALQMLERGTFHPSLVLLDLNIPEVSGLEVLEQYHSRGIPIVVLSGSSRETDKSLALELGASEYFQKPTDLQTYRDTLWGIVERWVSWKPRGASNEASRSWGPAMATASGAACDEKLRLFLEWNKAAQEYSDAVTNLSVRIGISVRQEYQRLQHLVEETRIALEQARLALDKHVSLHHC